MDKADSPPTEVDFTPDSALLERSISDIEVQFGHISTPNGVT